MSEDPFAGRAAALLEKLESTPDIEQAPEAWLDTAENCVLARIDSLRIVGGIARHRASLPTAERYSRLNSLFRFWASGCINVVDEALFADILNRHRPAR